VLLTAVARSQARKTKQSDDHRKQIVGFLLSSSSTLFLCNCDRAKGRTRYSLHSSKGLESEKREERLKRKVDTIERGKENGGITFWVKTLAKREGD
jgi:hypothetical protein